MRDPEEYSNVREMLGGFIGKRIAEITQHDEDEWAEDQLSYVQLHFEDGSYLKFYIMDDDYGFDVHTEGT
jgi:hypothetical protein